MKADAESTARGHASALAEGRLRADHIQARFKVAPSGDLDCRQIQWLGYHEAGLAGALAPPLQAALSFFREHFSEQFKRQTEFAFHHHLPAGFLGSCFNEAALEFNLPSFALHRDNIVYDNDWVAAVVVLKSPPHDASDLVFPEFGVGVELRAGDVALYRAKALHGFTPLDESAASTDRIDLCFGGICRPLESDF